MRGTIGIVLMVLAACRAAESEPPPPPAPGAIDWVAYGRDHGGSRYSPAEQITPQNVSQLVVAWRYRTGDWIPGRTRFEATPLLVDGTLYVSTPLGRVIALDPESGAERWSFDPRIDLSGRYGDFANRGVATWLDPSRTGGPCRRRIFIAPIDARLIALDAATGQRCTDFGTSGEVDLKRDLVNPPFEPGEYQITSPAAIAGSLVIVGSSIGDNNRLDTPSGVVRAFDARTGAQRWMWDPIPRHAGTPGAETWRGPNARRTGSANVWSGISVDTARDLVFLPTGSAAPDFYGGERLGQNLYANSLVALRASTGAYVWHFQAVHHDLWDYDLPAQPALVTVHRDGRDVPAVIIVSKMGHMFVLDRRTGVPLFPVEERPVPASDVPGEEAWPTQPVPVRPPPLVPQRLTAADVSGTPADRAWCAQAVQGLRSDGMFTPPSLRGSILFPGNIGGSNWSGVATDEQRGVAVTPTNRLATIVRLIPRIAFDSVARAHPDWQATPQRGTAFGMMRRTLRAPSGVPCNRPPFGALTAVDLATGRVKWEVPLGNDSTGSLNLGGAMVTAGGLVFVAGTIDQRLRAFDIETGRQLWYADLPAAGNAMPMTYQLRPGGKQFVVIAAGGRPPIWRQGDYVIAFALDHQALPPAPPVQMADVVGSWAGELMVGGNRLSTTVELRETNARVTGDFRVTAPRVTGPINGSMVTEGVSVRIPFNNEGERCTGEAAGILALANAGRLLVGELRLTGACSDDGEELGTLALRRP